MCVKRNVLLGMVMVAMMTAATGCAAKSGGAPERSARPVRVVVDNRNWEAATIYIERSGARWKIASVPALAARTLSVDSRLLSAGHDVRLIAEMRMTRESFHSNLFNAAGARSVELQIGSRLALSMVNVY